MIISDLNVLETVTAENIIGGCSHRRDNRRKKDDYKKYYDHDKRDEKKDEKKCECKCDDKKDDKHVAKKLVFVCEPEYSYKR
jgi:hypothetical protein